MHSTDWTVPGAIFGVALLLVLGPYGSRLYWDFKWFGWFLDDLGVPFNSCNRSISFQTEFLMSTQSNRNTSAQRTLSLGPGKSSQMAPLAWVRTGGFCQSEAEKNWECKRMHGGIGRHMLMLSPWTKIIISPSAGVYYWQRAFRCVSPLQNQPWEEFAKGAWSHELIFRYRLTGCWQAILSTETKRNVLSPALQEGHCGASTGHVRWLHGNHLAGSGQPGPLLISRSISLTLQYILSLFSDKSLFFWNMSWPNHNFLFYIRMKALDVAVAQIAHYIPVVTCVCSIPGTRS